VQELFNDGIEFDLENNTLTGSPTLVGYWRNDGASTWTDRSANSNDGTVSDTSPDTILLPEGTTTGKDILGFPLTHTNNGWLNLSGSEYVNLDGSVTFFSTHQIGSIEAWFKTDYSGAAQQIVSASDSTNASTDLTIFIATNGNPYIKVRNNAGGTVLEGYVATDYSDGSWHHLVVTFDGTTVIVYKDGGTAAGGEQDSSTAGGGNWTNLDTNIDDPTDYGGFLIGMRDTYYGVEFVGKINDVAIWDVELSAADVVAIYNSGAPNDLTDSGSYDTDRTGDLVGYWKFEEGSGSTATDSSGKGYDGTISGDTSYSTDVPS
jgi:hypothetical protein